MITTNNLPVGYKPYSTIKVCSNTLEGGGHLIVVGDVLPLLIGMGPKPLIWLQALVNPKPTKKQEKFLTIVDASIATHPLVRVSEKGDEITVAAGGKIVLRVSAVHPELVEVRELDLRPLGLNVYGDESKLIAGGVQFSTSKFSGVGTLIAFND